MDTEVVMKKELVLKVKYGDTLRRSSVSVNGNGSLELDMAGLRAKIINLFKFAPDADLTLTYVDEDDDLVTIVDDADLCDAVKQRLNPLRVIVVLNSDNAGNYVKSGSSSPIRSPRNAFVGAPFVTPIEPPPPSTLVGTSFTPMVPTVSTRVRTSSFAPMGPPPFTPVGPAPSHDQPSKPSSSTAAIHEQSLSKLVHNLASAVASAAPEQYHDILSKFSHDVASKALSVSPVLTETFSKLGISKQVPVSEGQGGTVTKKQRDSSEKHELSPNVKNGDASYSPVNLTRSVSTSDPQSAFIPSQFTALPVQGVQMRPVAPQNKNSVTDQLGQSASLSLPSGGYYQVTPPTNNYVNSDNMGRIFHQGVRCDGCGVHPITGPRYKSKVKEDYDLCSICVADMGNETDYTRMDRPMCYRPPRLRKFHHPCARHILPHGLRSHGLRSTNRPKHDSRFIEDVNIVDGTLMAPQTPFTKIWRMHNNGTVAWPRGTQLVWIGGDQLTDIQSFEVELPVEGCLVGMDLNVAINFTAPELPGQYVSYWRMALPSGQKFGQCVWVLIQVDTPQSNSQPESCRSLNLNLPPDSCDFSYQIIDVNAEAEGASNPECHSNKVVELVKPMVDGCTSKGMEPINSNNDNSLSVPPEVPAAEFSVSVDLSVVPSEPTPIAAMQTLSGEVSEGNTIEQSPTPIAAMQTFSGEVSEGNTIEQSLMKELEEMGFREIDLNKEILRANEYDMDRSLDDLFGFAEWDPMLEELKEMGFDDKETNRKLLIKNGGSITRVVRDLIAAENSSMLGEGA